MRRFILNDGAGVAILRPVEGESLAAVTAALAPGYVIDAELLGEDRNVIAVKPLPDGLRRYTVLTWFLRTHGDELKEWLRTEFPEESRRR